MKYILYAFILAASSLVAVIILPAEPVAAAVTYSCPEGQVQGMSNRNQDIRYCYVQPCPAGQETGIKNHTSGASDPTKCYKTSDILHPDAIVLPQGDAITQRTDPVIYHGSDGMKCPQGSHRGGLLASQSADKCYTCDADGCKEVLHQPLVPQHLQACLITDKSCIAAQRRAQDDYIKSIENSAPRGFKIPRNGEGFAYSASAGKYCEYYNKMNWIQHYEARYLRSACMIGYEVGFGKGDICTREYLFGHDATHRSIPTYGGRALNRHANTLRLSERNLLVSDAIKACQDGWVQYSVDYWYCEGDSGCESKLRVEQSRVINPGPRPTKTNYVDEDGNVVETYNAVATSQNCGSVQTAFFTCGFGSGVQNSTLWQVIQMVLNILIGLVGIAAVGGLVYGAIRYSSAGDNASQVEQAKTIIKNVIIGLVLFLAMWATLQYMIPGGIFSSS